MRNNALHFPVSLYKQGGLGNSASMSPKASSQWEGYLPKRALVMKKKRALEFGQERDPSFKLVFVGEPLTPPADQLLTKMIEAMGLKRDEVCVCTALPSHVHPKVVVVLGQVSSQDFGKAKVIQSFHPSYLLSHPLAKKEAWEHLKKVAKELGIKIPPASKAKA